jgi:hypothetical protein
MLAMATPRPMPSCWEVANRVFAARRLAVGIVEKPTVV